VQVHTPVLSKAALHSKTALLEFSTSQIPPHSVVAPSLSHALQHFRGAKEQLAIDRDG
jgi:hypothetical protein